MGLFNNPLSYAGYPPGVTGTPTTQNTTVRAATAAEAATGTLTDCYISPATADSATALDFASPPVLGFGSTTPRPVHATTLDSTGNTSLGTGASSVVNVGSGASATIGFFGATAVAKPASTDDLRTALINLGLYTTGGASPLNLNGGTLTAATVHATTIDTNVAAAQLSATSTTLAATGSDANVSMNLTTKGTGSIVFSQSKAGVDQNIQITNSDNTAAAGNAGIQLAVGGSTSLGDPYIRFEISGVAASTMSMGLDNSDSDKFVISNSTALGTSNALTLTQTGALTVNNIALTAPTVAGASPVVNNARAGQASFSDVIANGAYGTLTITNSSVTAASIIIASASCTTANSAVQIVDIVPGAGTVAMRLFNAGAASTNVNININYSVLN